MKKTSFLFLTISILISSCTKESLTEEVYDFNNRNTSLDTISNIEDNKNESINNFLSPPYYSDINSTSGTTYINSFSPKNILVSKDLLSLSIYEDWNNERKNIKADNFRYLDFNNDGKLDLFAFREHRGMIFESSYSNGEYVLYSDIFNSAELVDVKESRRMYMGLIEMNDFDGDGNPEFVLYSQEAHLSDWTNQRINTLQPLSYIDITIEGDILVSYIGPDTGAHDITSADIDNDGDIDIINFEWWLSFRPVGYKNVPLFYINDGNGNFTTTYEKFVFPDMFYEDRTEFHKLTVDSYDLDNDGIIDLVYGDGMNTNLEITTDCITTKNNPCGKYDVPLYGGTHVTWGENDGIYKFNNSSLLKLNLNENEGKGILGYQFLDVNRDGLVDIISFGVGNTYTRGFIDVYYNLGNRTFSESVEVDSWDVLDQSKNTQDYLSLPFTFQIVDVNNDGLFDLRPTFRYESDWYMYYQEKGGNIMGDGVYWKNNGNGFDRIEDIFQE